MGNSADRYREIVESRRKTEPTYTVTSPSGMEWTMRRISIPTYIATGKLPLSISRKIAEGLQTRDLSEVFQALSVAEQFEALRFVQYLVREAVISPKIVAEAAGPDEIDELLPEDFSFLVKEVAGGAEAERLGTFRGGRSGRVPVGGAGRKAVRKKAK